MADSTSVTAALATLQAAGWNVTPGNTYQGAGVLNASQAAWVQSSVSGGGVLAPSNIGTKCVQPFGDTAAHGIDRTYHFETVIEADADQFRIALFNVHTSTMTGIKAAVGVSDTIGTDVTSTTYTATTWVDYTWAAASSVTLPIGAAGRPSVTVSDWMQLSTIARTDGGTLPVVHTRIEVPSANVTATKFSPVVADTAWLRDPTLCGGRIFRAMFTDALAVTTKGAFTGTSASPRWFPFAIQYKSRKRIRTIFPVGDSIAGGVAAAGENYYRSAYFEAQALTSTIAKPIELANFGWSGQTSTQYALRLQDLITAGVLGKGCVVPYHAWTPNDITGTIDATEVTGLRWRAYDAYDRIQTAGGWPILTLGTPANNAAKAYGSSDSLRIAYNAEIAASGLPYWDLSTVLSGAVNSGQIEYSATASTDGLHPKAGATGYGLAAPVFVAAAGAALT